MRKWQASSANFGLGTGEALESSKKQTRAEYKRRLKARWLFYLNDNNKAG